MIRINKYPIHQILRNVIMTRSIKNKNGGKKEYGGHIVRMDSMRLRTFASYGTKCVKCGIRGIFFALEKGCTNIYHNAAHFNLYALNDQGKEMLMTKDHVIPRSKGGKNLLRNMQPMCSKCNGEKGDKDE